MSDVLVNVLQRKAGNYEKNATGFIVVVRTHVQHKELIHVTEVCDRSGPRNPSSEALCMGGSDFYQALGCDLELHPGHVAVGALNKKAMGREWMYGDLVMPVSG